MLASCKWQVHAFQRIIAIVYCFYAIYIFTFIQVDTEDLIGSNLGEWNVVSTSAEVVKQQYSCCVEPYLHMEYIFNISRRSDAYKVAIIAPCLILMLIITCSFLLTPESGEKLWLNGVATICSIMYLIYINYLVPFHQDRVPLIGNNWFSNDIIISNFQVLCRIDWKLIRY